MKLLYIPLSLSLSLSLSLTFFLSFHFMVYASIRLSMQKYAYDSTHINSYNFIFIIFNSTILIL
jgi:hypothetical protein